ncbi:MAG: PPC domain-containing protein [Sandaracinaceae bacterium]
MKRLSLGAALILGLSTTACDDGATPTDGGGPGSDAGMMGADTGMPPTGDGNDSFADADPLTLGEATTNRISPAGDLDYFSFEGTADSWVQIFTLANPEGATDMIDTVITLYDASMTAIAENDDRLPRTDTDSEIITRLPATGTYYVLVQEFSTWPGAEMPAPMAEGGDTFTYELTVQELSPDFAAVNIDMEMGDDVASAQSMRRNGTAAIVVGGWDDASDVDVYSFLMAANPNPNFIVLPAGPTGSGATMPAAMWVTSMDGTDTIARIAPTGTGLINFGPSLPLGRYNLHIQSGQAGAFYVIKSFITDDYTREAQDAMNGDPLMAEALVVEPDMDMPTIRQGSILAQLPEPDVDYYSFGNMTGEVVSVSCVSRTSGSGIQDLMVEVTSADGMTVVGSATETATDSAFIEELALPSVGTYLIHLTRGAQIANVSGQWARCLVTLAPPPP